MDCTAVNYPLQDLRFQAVMVCHPFSTVLGFAIEAHSRVLQDLMATDAYLKPWEAAASLLEVQEVA